MSFCFKFSCSYNAAHNNEEDWAAKARAWADAKTAMENQHSQSQFTPVGRVEDQSHYYDQYPQSIDTHYPDIQDQSLSASSYQQFPVSGAPLHQPSLVYSQEIASIGSEPSSYVPDARLPYNIRDGTSTGDSSAVFHHQGNILSSSSVHQQEVPSSYSSVTGNNSLSILSLYMKLVLKNCCYGTVFDQFFLLALGVWEQRNPL